MNTISALSVAKSGTAMPLQEQICQAVVSEASRHFADRLQAVILTGSMARDEATFFSRTSRIEVLGDAEFVLVFRNLPGRAAIESFNRDAEKACDTQQFACKIDCSAVLHNYFQTLRPSIYSYELLNCGRVCGGDSHVFRDTPRFSASEIPREDAWRMLCNRLIELLEALPEEGVSPLSSEVDYRALKVKLDLATSILVFAGLFQSGYEVRAGIFREHRPELSARTGMELAQFSTELEDCTRAKLGRAPIPHCDRTQLQGIVRLALDICSWELQEMLGTSIASVEPEKLMQMWIDRQPLKTRLRGWAYIAREEGWLASWKQWPRWSRMALGASPRYWIYAAALRVARQFASGEAGENSAQAYELPLSARALNSQQALRQEIARNYRECVVGTNA